MSSSVSPGARSVTSSTTTPTPQGTAAGPPLGLVFSSLLRADFLVFLKNRRALIISMVLPFFVLISTSGNKATDKFGGAEFVIGLAISYSLLSTALVGYALTVARDREKGVFQRLRVTPAPTWTIMTSRLADAGRREPDHLDRRLDHRQPDPPHLTLRWAVRTGAAGLDPGRGGVPQPRPSAGRPGEVSRQRPGGRARAVRGPDPARTSRPERCPWLVLEFGRAVDVRSER